MADVNGDYIGSQIDALASSISDGAGGDYISTQFNALLSSAISGSGVGAGGALTYYMRGYDGTLSRNVYWLSVVIDTAGVQYTGPGPLSNVVIAKILGH